MLASSAPSRRTADLMARSRSTAGFLPDDEGEALLAAARVGARSGPLLEVGSWRGKSALVLAAAALEAATVVFTVDHHRGSEELQPGWDGHDPEVVDPRTGRIDSLPHLRRTIEDAGVESTVIAVVGDSPTVGRHWRLPLGMVFVDGGHSHAPAHADYEAWSAHVDTGGLLAVHDVFEDLADGGPAPHEIYQRALRGGFVEVPELACGSLRVARRVGS